MTKATRKSASKKASQKRPSKLGRAILEMSADMHRGGTMSAAEHSDIIDKITMRDLRGVAAATAVPIEADEIRTLREKAHMSQAALAHYLNVTVGYVSQIERGVKTPKGPALVLLNVIRRKGIQAIL
jgi:putative transcriptional regulator